MSEQNKRKILNEMQKNVQGEEAARMICPVCGREFSYEAEAILFNEPTNCEHCGESFILKQNEVPNALDSIASQIADIQKRNRKRNRRRGR